MATSISVTRTIIKFFEVDDSVVLPQNAEAVILQNVLQWLRFDNMDIKWNATRILFMLIRNPENASLIIAIFNNTAESTLTFEKK